MNIFCFIILSFVCVCSPDDVFIVPYQSRGTSEIYEERGYRVYRGLDIHLELSHSYERFDQILLLPVDYQGISELYTLGFYVDLDITIDEPLDAHHYRILYWFPESQFMPAVIIPEPSLLLMFMLSATILCMKKKKI